MQKKLTVNGLDGTLISTRNLRLAYGRRTSGLGPLREIRRDVPQPAEFLFK